MATPVLHWASWLTLIAIAGILSFAIWRGWSIVQGLAVAMVVPFVLSVLAQGGLDLRVHGSPVVADLAWRAGYMMPQGWTHWWTLVTTMFLHADAVHIVSNLIIFLFMGLGLEERIGRWRFLGVYLVGGAFGTLVHSIGFLEPIDPRTYVIGASGAVFAVIGAYATLYPNDKVVLFFLLIIPNVPVYVASILYTLLELLAVATIGSGGGVARLAHLGGIVGGVLIALLVLKRSKHLFDPQAARAGHKVDLGAVRTLVTTPEQRGLLAKVEANIDEPELLDAWLGRLSASLSCRECGEGLHPVRGQAIACPKGHRYPLR